MEHLLAPLYLVSALAGAACAAVLFRQAEVPGGRWLGVMVLAASFWALCDAVEVGLPTVEGRLYLSQLQYLGVLAVAPAFARAVHSLAHPGLRPTPGASLAIWLIPLLSLGVAWTSHFHGWLWTGITLPERIPGLAEYHYGPWFWVIVVHSYLLLGWGSWTLVQVARKVTRPFRTPLWILTAAILIPWLGNLAYNLKLGPIPGLNWFTVSLLLTGGILAWISWRQGLLDILPAGRDALLEHLSDGVLLLDREDGVLFRNPAAESILGGAGALDFLVAELVARGGEEGEVRGLEIRMGSGEESRWIELRADRIRDRWNEVAGRFVILRDVTQRRRWEEEREGLIRELQGALREVRTLQELLPACARCRKVRDDTGGWGRLEEYLRTRTTLRFTHGICPECAEELYGGVIELQEDEEGVG